MNILVTGAAGFVGKNLVENLKNIKDGKDCTRPGIKIDNIFEYDRNTGEDLLEEYCMECTFVFHLAGINRPEDPSEFMTENSGFLSQLLELLRKRHNTCPIMFSSSIQASCAGRYQGSQYGRSKLEGEKMLLKYSQKTNAKVLIYRLPNLYGKWSKPNYNSVVATFCNAIANDLEYRVNDRNTEIELLYIDDLINELLDALENHEHRCEYDKMTPIATDQGRYCFVPVTDTVTLGEVADLLNFFKSVPQTLGMPELASGSFVKKLFSTYLSYLPKQAFSFPVNMKGDERGVFAELIKTPNCGQISVNIVKPGNMRGEHWHNSKWEIFIVVSGHGLIRQRKVGVDPKGRPYPIIEFEVAGEKMEAVQIIPGYVHDIINLSDTEDLVTVMWANEPFDFWHPDTYSEKVAEVK